MKISTGRFTRYLQAQSTIILVGALIANALMFYCFRYLDWGPQFTFTHSYVVNSSLRTALDLVISVICVLPLIWTANRLSIGTHHGDRGVISFCAAHTALAATFLLLVLPAAQLFWMDQVSSSASILWNEDYSVVLSAFRICGAFCSIPISLINLIIAFSPVDQLQTFFKRS